MQELRVQIEAVPTAEGNILSAWFTLPIDEETFSERLGVDAESNDYRITEKELPLPRKWTKIPQWIGSMILLHL